MPIPIGAGLRATDRVGMSKYRESNTFIVGFGIR